MIDGKYTALSLQKKNGRSVVSLLKKAFKQYKKTGETIILVSCESNISEIVFSELLLRGGSVLLESRLFSLLKNPNLYSFRFYGKMEEDLSFFEFFECELSDSIIRKKETRCLFEDCVFSYYRGNALRAYNGFSNLLKIDPKDKTSVYYYLKSKKLLDWELYEDI